MFIDQMSADYEALRDEVSEGYDLVEGRSRVYVFCK